MGRSIAKFGTLLTGTFILRIVLAGAVWLPLPGCVLTQQAWSPPQAGPLPQPAPANRPMTNLFPTQPLPGFAPNGGFQSPRVDSNPQNLTPDLGTPQSSPEGTTLLPAPDSAEERAVERRGTNDEPDPEPLPRSTPDERTLEREPARKPTQGPEFRAPELGGGGPRIELSVKSSDECLVDDQVVYAITLRNTSDAALDGVRIEVSFDEGLVFPGSTETRVGREFDEIETRGTRQFTLTLVASKAGRQCCRFAIFEQSVESAKKTACIDVSPRKVSVSIIGPAERYAGNRAEFNVKLANMSESKHHNVRLSLAYEQTLKPVEWSSDAEQSDGRLSWKLGDFAPGEGVQVQAEFECLHDSQETCITAYVSVDDGVPERRQFCFRIAPLEGPLTLEASDEGDPLTVGKQSAYVVRVKNRGAQEVSDVRVSAEAPLLFDVLSAKAEVDGKPAAKQPEVDGRSVTLSLDSLPVDSVLVLRIRIKGTTVGDDRLRVTVASAGNNDLTTAEPTTINPARPE